MIVALMHFLPDEEKPAEIIAAQLDALAQENFLTTSHATAKRDLNGRIAGSAPARRRGSRSSSAAQMSSSG